MGRRKYYLVSGGCLWQSIHRADAPLSLYKPHTQDILITKELDVFGLLNELNTGKPLGPGEMHPRLPEKLAHFVSNPSSICFSLSVTQD